MCEANKRKFIPRDPPSDYECTIIKTTKKKKRQSNLKDFVTIETKRNNQ